ANRQFCFQQDNSPIHKARAITDLFEHHNIRILDWPAYSPNINPIENLWAILKGKVEKEVSE
ncbi:8244_t:CDS:2, partial [Paraglomus occultum]